MGSLRVEQSVRTDDSKVSSEPGTVSNLQLLPVVFGSLVYPAVEERRKFSTSNIMSDDKASSKTPDFNDRLSS